MAAAVIALFLGLALNLVALYRGTESTATRGCEFTSTGRSLMVVAAALYLAATAIFVSALVHV